MTIMNPPHYTLQERMAPDIPESEPTPQLSYYALKSEVPFMLCL